MIQTAASTTNFSSGQDGESRPKGIVILLALILAGLWSLPAGSSASESQAAALRVAIEDPRPLAEAIRLLERRHGWVITYEDPEYSFPQDILDVTEKVRRTKNAKKPSHRILVPLGGKIEFEYAVLPDKDSVANAESAAQSALAAHEQARLPGVFQIQRSHTAFHVVPVRIKNRKGQITEVASPLTTRVSIKSGERNGMELLKEFADALSRASRQKIVVGTIPLNLLGNHRTKQSADSEIARKLLHRFLNELGTPLSWKLYFDPGTREYVLNIHPVGKDLKEK